MKRGISFLQMIVGLSLAASMAFASTEVNVYSHRHYDSDKALFKAFEEKSGIKVYHHKIKNVSFTFFRLKGQSFKHFTSVKEKKQKNRKKVKWDKVKKKKLKIKEWSRMQRHSDREILTIKVWTSSIASPPVFNCQYVITTNFGQSLIQFLYKCAIMSTFLRK